MQQRKRNYRFHDPNPASAAADFVLQVLLEANAGKVAEALRAAVDSAAREERQKERSA